MARVHTSRFVGRAGKTRLPVKAVGGPDDPANGDGPRLVLVCGRGDFIEKGESYMWFAPGFRSSKRIRCMRHHPRPSELDGSIYSEVLAAQEDFGDAGRDTTGNPDDIRSAVDSAIEGVKDAIESVAEQYDTAAESMGGGYGAGAQFEEWASNLRDADIVDWTAGDYDDPPTHDGHDEHVDGCEECAALIESWASDLWDEADTKVNDVSKE